MSDIRMTRIEQTSLRHGRRIGIEVSFELSRPEPGSRLSYMKSWTFMQSTIRNMLGFYFWQAVGGLDCDCEQRYAFIDNGTSVTALDLHPTHASWTDLEALMKEAVLAMMEDLGFGSAEAQFEG